MRAISAVAELFVFNTANSYCVWFRSPDNDATGDTFDKSTKLDTLDYSMNIRWARVAQKNEKKLRKKSGWAYELSKTPWAYACVFVSFPM